MRQSGHHDPFSKTLQLKNIECPTLTSKSQSDFKELTTDAQCGKTLDAQNPLEILNVENVFFWTFHYIEVCTEKTDALTSFVFNRNLSKVHFLQEHTWKIGPGRNLHVSAPPPLIQKTKRTTELHLEQSNQQYID